MKTIKNQLTKAFAPVKAALAAKFGNIITLYRGQTDVSDKTRSTLSWTSDPRVAAHFVGVAAHEVKLKPITDAEIASALKQYQTTGKVKWQNRTYVRTDEPTDGTSTDEFYYEIYDRSGDLITDGDDLAQQLRDDQKYYQELIDARDSKYSRILKAAIPLDDIIWITDRAGQSEFILHNQSGRAGYVDVTGKLIKS